MSCKQDKPAIHVLPSKPSLSFSTVSAAASATSAASSRSGGSRLLFGEIDTSSERSSESFASVCSFVLCDSSTFLKFWLDDNCRETFLSHVRRTDLASLRLACHDFSVRAAPALFNALTITFRPSAFTKPARLAALDRLGFYVKTLSFNLPHSTETFLPPLVDPETGAALSFTYTPQIEAPSAKRPKYGDLGTTEILTRQWPTLFHAATNVPAFIRAFSGFMNLSHLKISCPGYDPAQRYRRSIVDFALISLRIAVERNNLNALDTLTLSPIHPMGLQYLSPLFGHGATPRSASRWSHIQHLTLHADALPNSDLKSEADHFKLLQTYLRNFQYNLMTFNFRWNGDKGPIPIQRPIMSVTFNEEHPVDSQQPTDVSSPLRRRKAMPSLRFPKLQHAEFESVKATAKDISTFVKAHKHTIAELNFENVELEHGTWDDALAPLTKLARPRVCEETADIPIMLSPTLPTPMERIEVAQQDANGRKSLRMSRWLSSKSKGGGTPAAARKVKEGLLGCEEQLKKVFRGSLFSRR